MLTTFATYQLITRDLDRSLDLKAAEAPLALQTDYYLKNIGSIKTIDAFIGNTRLFNYAMTAFGLDDMSHAKAYMRKVLTEGVNDPDSFANKINDDRFVAFAKTFNFERDGEDAMATYTAQYGVVNKFIRQNLEISAGQENEGVRLALYFLREAPKVDSVYDLMADPALWKVITTTFGFPEEMAAADIEKQAAAVLKKLDIADFADPEKVDAMIQRFTAIWDATEIVTQDPVLALFGALAPAAGINLDLIMTLNTIKNGGA